MIIGLTSSVPLKKKRYINPKIEAELVEFKKEIEQKFEKSQIKNFKFPIRNNLSHLPDPMRKSFNPFTSEDFGDAPSPFGYQGSTRKNKVYLNSINESRSQFKQREP